MSKYETYKPSGIDWIGEYPFHWRLERMKYAFAYEKGVNAALYTQEYLADNFGNYPVYSGQTEEEGVMGYIKSFDYDFPEVLFTTTVGAKAMTLLKLNGKFSLSQNCAIIFPKKKDINITFYFYFLQSQFDYEKGKISLIMQPSLRFQDLDFNKVIFPAFEEQLTIANYLDHQTLKIDRLIANKKAQAEKLKELRQIEINNAVTKGLNPIAEMKDSGIDWLGKIPKHWTVKRLKSILININSGDGITNDDLVEDGEFEIYGGNGVMGYTDKYNSEGKVIVIGRVGAKCGVVYLVDKKIWISDNALQSRTYNSYEFVYYLIDAMNLNNYANQNAQPLITGGILKVLYAGVPPKEEQIQIAKHLQERTTAIDKLISNIDAQIEKLQELRKIKIYEAVTGKIKVNAYVEATA